MSTRRDETRARVLDAARSVLVERGYHGVGLEEVATAAGVSRQAVYQHHFRSKSELLLALVAHVDAVADVQGLVAPVVAAPTAVDALDAMVAALATVDERIHDIAGLLAAVRVTDPGAEAAWQSRMTQRLGGARLVVQRLHREGRLAAGWTVPDAADFLFTALSHATYQSLVLERGWPKKRYVRHLRRVLRASLVKPRAR